MSESKVYVKYLIGDFSVRHGHVKELYYVLPRRGDCVIVVEIDGLEHVFKLPVNRAELVNGKDCSSVSVANVREDLFRIIAVGHYSNMISVRAYSKVPTFCLNGWEECDDGSNHVAPDEELYSKYKAFLKKGYFV